MQTLAQLTGISGEVDVGPVQAAGDAEALLQRVWVAEPIVWHRCSGRKAGWKSLAGKAGEQTTLCKAAHCSAMVVLCQGGVQGRQQQQQQQWRWLEVVVVPVPGEETWAAAWECAGGSCHWLAPRKEQRRLERTGRVDQLGWN